MSPIKTLLLTAITTIFILGLISLFNYRVDPMCYYHCSDIDPHKGSVNHFYEVGQIILNHPETEVVVLGSSRSQTTPPLWISKVLHKPTLNLGMGGADLFSKWALLNMALAHTKTKEVIWYTDFFEFTPEMTDVAIKSTPAIRKYLKDDPALENAAPYKNPYFEIFDHNTLEAALYSLKKTPPDKTNWGSGSYLDSDLCVSGNYKGEKTPTDLEKEKDSAFEHYTRKIFPPPSSSLEWDLFIKKLQALSQNKIETRIVITPYNPTFTQRLEKEFPEQFKRHQEWRRKLAEIKIPHVQVFDLFSGIPKDDQSTRFWNDGVHYTCRGAMGLLKPVLESLKN